MTLKSTLKTLKLNESSVSMVLGALVIIVVGLLLVNYFRKTNSGVTLPTVETETERDAAGRELYTVGEGETLWQIADKKLGSGYRWTEIAEVNNLADPSQISAGQKLAIPGSTTEIATASPTESPLVTETEEPTAPSVTGTNYTVVSGDTLWDIAQRAYGNPYRWSEIAKANAGTVRNPNLIYPDQVLVLPR